MTEKSWELIHRIFEKMRGLLAEPGNPADAVLSDTQASLEADRGPTEVARTLLGLDEMVHVRAEIRAELDVFRAALAEHLSERDCYLVVFPIVAHFDELVQTRYLDPEQTNWPSLQLELFQINDAGEVFYDTLDDLLLKPQTLPLIFEVFYLCLSDGFVGRQAGNPARIAEYMERLRTRIPVKDAKSIPIESVETVFIEDPGSPVWYYVIDLGFFVVLYFALSAFGRMWNSGF